MSTFAILYLRPDGWWVAGGGFDSRDDAEECATAQLPDHVEWQVVGESTDLFEIASEQSQDSGRDK